MGHGWVKLKVSDAQNIKQARECVNDSVLKYTIYKNKWALQIFWQWQDQRMCKICSIEPGGLFKGDNIGKDVQELTESIENMNVKL